MFLFYFSYAELGYQLLKQIIWTGSYKVNFHNFHNNRLSLAGSHKPVMILKKKLT
jgi:hypothetical protein